MYQNSNYITITSNEVKRGIRLNICYQCQTPDVVMGEYSDMGDHKESSLQKTPKMYFQTITHYELQRLR